MKKLLAALTVLTLMSIASSAMASKDHQCIQLAYKWYYMSEPGVTYAKLYQNGTFQTASGHWGYWELFKSAYMLQYMTGCKPLYAGSKKQGFFQCTDGDGPTEPNYFMIKKSKNCAGVGDTIVGEPAEADGPNSATPE